MRTLFLSFLFTTIIISTGYAQQTPPVEQLGRCVVRGASGTVYSNRVRNPNDISDQHYKDVIEVISKCRLGDRLGIIDVDMEPIDIALDHCDTRYPITIREARSSSQFPALICTYGGIPRCLRGNMGFGRDC